MPTESHIVLTLEDLTELCGPSVYLDWHRKREYVSVILDIKTAEPLYIFPSQEHLTMFTLIFTGN